MTTIGEAPPTHAVRAAQRILDGPWKHAASALGACRSGTWSEFVRAIAPPRPLLIGRRDHGRCLGLAQRQPLGPETQSLTVVPLWACSAEDDVSNEWIAVHGIADASTELCVQETGPFIAMEDANPRASALWICTVRRWRAATVVTSRSFAPDISLLLRAGEFAVLELDVDEVLSVEEQPTEERPRPTREVPVFSSWFEPRVAVEPTLASQIAGLCFTAPDE